MADKWYAEAKNFNGEWKPFIQHGARPAEKLSCGTIRELRNVKQIDGNLEGLTLTELEAHFGSTGNSHVEFRSTRAKPAT
jgi:hypothetical protein